MLGCGHAAACLRCRALLFTMLQCHTRLFSMPKYMRQLLEAEDNVLSMERPPVMHVGKGIM